MKTTIRIQNFKSLEDVTLELAPTTVFLGPNGAGKSSVLKCLEFVFNNIYKITPSKPQKTNYKLQNNVNLGFYRNIVTNNDQTKDIVVEISHDDSGIDSYINEVRIFWLKPSLNDNMFSKEELFNRRLRQTWLDVHNLIDFSESEKEQLVNLFFFQKNFFEYTKKNFSTLDFNIKISFGNLFGQYNLKEILLSDKESGANFNIRFEKSENNKILGIIDFHLSSKFYTQILNKELDDFSWKIFDDNREFLATIFRKFINSYTELRDATKFSSESKKEELERAISELIKFLDLYPSILANKFNIKHIPPIRKNMGKFKKYSLQNGSYLENQYGSNYILNEDELDLFELWEKKSELSEELLINNSSINKEILQQIKQRASELEKIEEFVWEGYKEILYWLRKLKLAKYIYIKNHGKVSELFVESIGGTIHPYKNASSGLIQIFPIIAAVFDPMSVPFTYIYLEQPELHLHPKLQSGIAEFLQSSIQTQRHYTCQFIVETHSEHLIRGYQLLIAKGEIKPEHIRFYYFNPVDNKTEVINLKIDKLGNFITPWPNGFFSEASDLSYKLLEEQLKRQK